jgi:hypothetical protein
MHAERMRALPTSVENAGNQPLPPESAGVCGAARLALQDLDLDSFARHGAAV